jgi:hypothetical protein
LIRPEYSGVNPCTRLVIEERTTGSPRSRPRVSDGAPRGSAPTTRTRSPSACRSASDVPLISPPPPTGTTTTSTSGHSSAISRPTVPAPWIVRSAS